MNVTVDDLLDFEKMFSEDERKMFANRMPFLQDVQELKRLNKQIRLAVQEDSVEGYKRAAKLNKSKQKLINKKA